MKKGIVLTTAALIAGLSGLAGTAEAQTATPKPAASSAHKVGLIDMAYIFKNYKKFDALREDLKAEITETDTKAKAMMTQIKGLDDQLKAGGFKQGSPEFSQREKQILQLNTELESFRRNAQREFLSKESNIYKVIYVEVSEAVEKYAYHYQYTLIMRFNREDVGDAVEPQDVLSRMNRQVVYFRAEDDITESVLKYLNQRYDQSAPAAPAGGAARTGKAETGPKTR